MTNSSPANACTVALPPTLTLLVTTLPSASLTLRTQTLKPRSPSEPPSKPCGGTTRLSDKIDAVTGTRNSMSRTTPFPPRWAPAPPEFSSMENSRIRTGYLLSKTSASVIRVFVMFVWTPLTTVPCRSCSVAPGYSFVVSKALNVVSVFVVSAHAECEVVAARSRVGRRLEGAKNHSGNDSRSANVARHDSTAFVWIQKRRVGNHHFDGPQASLVQRDCFVHQAPQAVDDGRVRDCHWRIDIAVGLHACAGEVKHDFAVSARKYA
ncbi:hypothetical protein CLUG_02287 [Clavispora lusitaniae ATCC 42720]|uniref:Uncharacterized protein n=1 Tax=Clavispora lusitaniae (strain ATCC 42720) TaxID=306902 RepID=C4Y255_CLAL4|nr:uncharacterized protein CLUG_02287 [Clavispora lusitaniae ATCC 42720]EEQ38165.1 hypothetical protein CLUG_02287 [Clavispora lusitaniae ATCC 42720]